MPPAPLPIAWTYSHSIDRHARTAPRPGADWSSPVPRQILDSSTVAYIREYDVDVAGRRGRPRSAPDAPGRAGGSRRPSRRGCCPVPDSLPSDQAMTQGWFLSRSTMRLDPVEVHLAPVGVVGGVAHPAVRLEAVGLEVALVDHPEAELVGEVEQRRVRRVVARADRVEVVPLHEQQRLAHGLSASNTRPSIGSNSCRLTPRSRTRRPFTSQASPVDLDAAEPHAQP